MTRKVTVKARGAGEPVQSAANAAAPAEQKYMDYNYSNEPVEDIPMETLSAELIAEELRFADEIAAVSEPAAAPERSEGGHAPERAGSRHAAPDRAEGHRSARKSTASAERKSAPAKAPAEGERAPKKARKKGIGFTGWMLLYVAVMLAAMFTARHFLNDWIVRYDRELPKNVMARYIADFDEGDMRRVAGDFLSGIDLALEDTEESFAEVKGLFECAALTCAKDPSACTPTRQQYVMQLDGRDIGRVTLATTDSVEKKYNTAHWEIAEEQYDFSFLLKSAEFTAADCWQVYFNGRLLDSSYVNQDGISYKELEDYYERFPLLPKKCVYSVDDYAAEHEFTVVTEKGETLRGDLAELSSVLVNCSAEETAEIESFCADFAARYVQFSSNSGYGGFYYNCYYLQQLIVPGTDFYNRLPQSADSMVYVSGNYSKVESTAVNRATRLDENTYLVEMTYILSTGINATLIRSANDQRLILVRDENGVLKAESQMVYPAVVLE